jgi:hypothetical protein
MEQNHTQLLLDGMQSDSHPSLQPPNSYRDALNGNLISHGGNNYSFESTEGTTFNWQQPEHKTGEGKFVPIGFLRLGNRLLVHSTDNKSSVGGAGEIGIVTFNNAGVGTYSAKYYHEDLKYSQMHMIFGYGLEENDNYHRSYWTDNFNQPRTINTASAVLTTEYTSGGATPLVVGDQYMVLTDSVGSIEHPVGSGNFYGPKQALGNIFTATFTTFTTVGSAKVIGYLDPIILDYTPAKAMGSIDFAKYTFGGALFCGVYMYAYQLSTDDGYEASWSYTLNPIHVGPSNPASGYQQYTGSSASVNSGKAIQLTISDIPSIFTKIKVAVIEINSSVDVITNVEVFWMSDVSGSAMTVTHYGQEALLPMNIDDISLRNAVIMRCKDITTLKQRQIILNLTEREELDWTPTATLSPFTYEIPADQQGLASGAGNDKFYNPLCYSAGIASGSIEVGGHYVVRGGVGTIEYPQGSGTIYAQGETFIGLPFTVPSNTLFTATGTAIVKGCIRIKNYDKFAGGQSYKIIDLEDEYFDYKSMATHCYLRGHWRGETYRLAAVAWDHFGNPYAARWAGDITMPVQSDASGSYKLTNVYGAGGSSTHTTLNLLGIQVDGLDITSIKDDISAISIVRVPRDKTILAQSLLLQNVDRVLGTTTCPISTVFPSDDNWAAAAGGTTAYSWTLLGPELDFGTFSIPLVNGDNLTPVADLDAESNGGFLTARVGADQSIYSKYYFCRDFTLPGGTAGVGGYSPKLQFVQTVLTAGTTTYSQGGFSYTFKNHDIATSGSCSPPLSFTAGSDLFSKAAAGGQRTLIVTDTADFINQDNGNTGTGVSGSGFTSSRKVLVNYVRPKGTASLYGGTSLAAKANNKYIFTGHYLRIDSAVLADIVDGAGNYILNGMEVWGGDCFVQMYDRVTSMFNSDYNSTLLNNGSYSWGVIFPCESQINVALRLGAHMANVGMYENTYGILYKDSATSRGLQDEKYQYNSAYSSENNQIQYDALPLGLRLTNRFPYMARYSEQKFLGENIDNMRIFLINNFKNADALHGEINNGAVGFDRLFYWQDKGIGYFPVEERETTVGALGQAVQLGVGGVMQRADTMDKFFGNQHQSSLVQGPDFFEWFDMRRKAILRMTFQGGVADVTIVKGMSTFFQNIFTVAEPDAFNILNMDQPIMGQGIIGVYDPIKKTTYHTFKFSSDEYGPSGDLARNRDFTIGISATLGKFVGFFSFAPVIYIEHNSKVYAVKKSRQAILGLTSYAVYDEVAKNGASYVCIQAFTTTDPINPTQQPDVVGSAYWVKSGEEDEIHRMFNGDICKFFGVVYPWYISMVVNPMIDGEKTYDCAEAYGNDVAFSDVYCNTDNLTAQDVNITSTNRDYVYYDGKWFFNYPLAGKKRLTNQYMIVKLQVKNYLTNLTVSANLQKRLVYLKTMFRLRK